MTGETMWRAHGWSDHILTRACGLVVLAALLLGTGGGLPACSDDSSGGAEDAAGQRDTGLDASGCVAGQTRPCGSDEGACQPGTQTCGEDGEWGECEGAVGPAEELCNGIDDNCNGETDESFLALGTDCGVGACAGGVMECAADGTGTVCSTMPGGSDDRSSVEVCNDLDDDCDGETDEDATNVPAWYWDGDQDGYGTEDATIMGCAPPPGYVASSGDCDDMNASIHPFAEDRPGDGTDSNCDGRDDCVSFKTVGVYFVVCRGAVTWDEARQACRDAGYQDLASIRTAEEQQVVSALVANLGVSAWFGYNDQATEGTWVWSDTSDATYTNWGAGEPNDMGGEDCAVIYPTAGSPWNDSSCDSTTSAQGYICEVRQDGQGDFDGDGYDQASGDCDDMDVTIHPGAPELCDGKDNDCNGETDEDPDNTRTWYQDADGDGFGNPLATIQSCARPDGYVSNDGDCDDTKAWIRPFAGDVPGDGIDGDCDGLDCLAKRHGDAYFVFCTSQLTWGRANTACMNAGYDGLASIRSSDEQSFVLGMISGGKTPWIGYSDMAAEGTWVWVDHASSTYTNWGAGEPNDYQGREDCARIETDGTWNDSNCDSTVQSTSWLCSVHLATGEDFDGDGFLSGGGDCDDFNPGTHPGGEDVPADGIDSDCANDADGDGYDSIASGGVDCYDENADAYPGQTAFFTTHRGDGSFDYDCDGEETPQTTSIYTCQASGGGVIACSCTFTEGWVDGTPPGCGETEKYEAQCMAIGPPCSCIPVVGTDRTQACR